MSYDYSNIYDSCYSPSEIHLTDTGIVQYYSRYLLQKCMSVFEWTLPDNWERNYFLYTLYGWGFLAVINTDKFGVIPQACGLQGYNVFYQPTHAVISNPLIDSTMRPKIGYDCTLIRLQPNYRSVMDIVKYHAQLLGLAYETLTTNLLNSKLAYVATADTKAEAEGLKKLYDEIARGVPAVVHKLGRKKTGLDAEAPPLQLLTQNVGQNYISDDIMTTMRAIERHFLTEVGITTNQTEGRKEHPIEAEIQTAEYESHSNVSIWYDELKKTCAQTRDMFGVNLYVRWRDVDEGNSLSAGYDGLAGRQSRGGNQSLGQL